VNALVWNAPGEVLVSGGSDGNLRWWDVQHGECLLLRQEHQGAVQSLRVSPDNQRLASCGDDNTVQVWNLESGEHLRTLQRDRPYERLNITGIRGVTEAQLTTLRALGAIDDAAPSNTWHAANSEGCQKIAE
jgi:WD40 repeat protein